MREFLPESFINEGPPVDQGRQVKLDIIVDPKTPPLHALVYSPKQPLVILDYAPLEPYSGDPNIRQGSVAAPKEGAHYTVRTRSIFGEDLVDPRAKEMAFPHGESHPRGVILPEEEDIETRENKPNIDKVERVIYEAQILELTNQLPGIPKEIRGTYRGVAHKATISYLKDLGITTIEFLPLQQFISEQHLIQDGMVNHWGYNTLGFFAPHDKYAYNKNPGGPTHEFKKMVDELHKAGIEVFLDVVYNHTAEEGDGGPVHHLKALSPNSYIMEAGHHTGYTGCGNSINISDPATLDMIIGSLRYWVEDMHIDGFRFDLATTMIRDKYGRIDFDNSPFISALKKDPDLSKLLAEGKIIVEPWDADVNSYGISKGRFSPNGMLEWNGDYQKAIRHAMVGRCTLGWIATSLGSRGREHPTITYWGTHDGFSARDIVSYNQKHNLYNGEDNDDGTNDNHSYNHGLEGPSDDASILLARRNALDVAQMLTLLARGIPMIPAGDELDRSKGGNNNTYCRKENDLNRYDINFSSLANSKSEEYRRHKLIKRLIKLRRDSKVSSINLQPDTQWRDMWGGDMLPGEIARRSQDKVFGMVAALGYALGKEVKQGNVNEELIVYYNGETGKDSVTVQLPNDRTGWKTEVLLTSGKDEPHRGGPEIINGKFELHRLGAVVVRLSRPDQAPVSTDSTDALPSAA